MTGATPIGHALSGAAIVRSGGRLSLWAAKQPGPVLVADGITASYISSRMTQRRLGYLGVEASVHVVEVAKTVTRVGLQATGPTASGVPPIGVASDMSVTAHCSKPGR